MLGTVFYLVLWFTDVKLFGLTLKDVPGFTTIILAVLFFSGIQLFSIGLIGQYLGRMYIEVKARPTYVTQEVLGFDPDQAPRGRS